MGAPYNRHCTNDRATIATDLMITGYNTDVSHRDLVLHVQTEDKGQEVATIESLVYVGGQIIGKRQSGYREVVESGGGKAAIVEIMDRQHRLMIAEIRNGEYDDQLVEQGMVPAAVEATGEQDRGLAPWIDEDSAPVTLATTPTSGEEGGSLDEIILEYLDSKAEQEHLVLMMEVDREFELGQPATLDFRTKTSISGEPVPETRISVKMISTVNEPTTLASGETDAHGQLRLGLQVPDLQRGSSALIVTASAEIGTAEIKHLL